MKKYRYLIVVSEVGQGDFTAETLIDREVESEGVGTAAQIEARVAAQSLQFARRAQGQGHKSQLVRVVWLGEVE